MKREPSVGIFRKQLPEGLNRERFETSPNPTIPISGLAVLYFTSKRYGCRCMPLGALHAPYYLMCLSTISTYKHIRFVATSDPSKS
jgi:hypothetical protein